MHDMAAGYCERVSSGEDTAPTAVRRYWNAVYERRRPTEVSWYQREPEISMSLIGARRLASDAAIVDVGGGVSPLAARLLDDGFSDVTVLDVSARALELARAALGPDAGRIRWLEQDLGSWAPQPRYDLWHDRAVFHFLVEQDRAARYAEVVRAALRVGGTAVIGTFASDGPPSCSGLAVARYDAARNTAVFAPGLGEIATRREEHHTPGGAVQPFTWVMLERRS